MAGTPGGVFVRRAEFDDAQAIQALVGDDAGTHSKRYGHFDVTNMIETASLGITAVDEKGAVVGYAAFYDHPALTPSIDPTTWPKWLHANFGHPEYTPATATWLAFFVADALLQNEVAESILRTAFTTLSETDVILFALRDDVRPFAPIRDTFEPLPALGPDADVRIHVCMRGLYLPELLIRKARVEDHDDLVPVFNAQSEVLSERYGEFFIAELIERQDERNCALVAEVDGHAIGLLSLSAEIDVALLKQTFDLEPYGNLEKVDAGALDRATAGIQAAKAAKIAKAKAEAEAKAAAAAAAKEVSAFDPSAAVAAATAEAEESAAREAELALAEVPRLTNAFCVSVFCMDESFESRSSDFLHAAFAAFPEREYAVLTLPHTIAEFSLVNSFSQVEALPSSSLGHILYVFHRDALGGAKSLTVRGANVTDAKAIDSLIGDPRRRALMKEAFDEATGPLASEPDARRTKSAYVAECVGQPVGLVIMDDACDVEQLQSQYALEDYVLFSEHAADAHAYLHTFVINPIFSRSSRFLLKEVFRQHRRSCIYLQLQTEAGEPIPSILPEFVQAKPRRIVEHSAQLEAELAEQRAQLGLGPRQVVAADASLYFLTRKLLSEPKIVNNARVVVVGASDAAISLLEAIVSVPYLSFSHIYLVAPRAAERLRRPRGDMARSYATDFYSSPFFSRSGSYTSAELKALGIGARVRLVDAAMVDIDRQAKAIVLPDASILPYDYLVIAPEFGDQSLYPLSGAASVRGAFSLFDEHAESAIADFIYTQARPHPPLTQAAPKLRPRESSCMALHLTCAPPSDPNCVQMYTHEDPRVCVYGGSIDAYTAIAALTSSALSVPPERITLVLPPPSDEEDIFADPRVLSKVHAVLESLGVRLVVDMKLVGLDADDQQLLQNMMLESSAGVVLSQPCQLLLCAGAKQVERTTFDAINSNSLVYDGRLVVDTKFCTNDKSVYAAGEIIKFSRRYRSKLSLGTVSGRECGEKLAAALLPVLDPLSANLLSTAEAPLPEFVAPKMVAAYMPGPLHYVSVGAPTAGCETYAKARRHASFGRELVFDDSERSFCSVVLDKNSIIRSITYLGSEPVEEQNWMRLIGLPEAALNNLAPRYDEGIVTDLPAFLRQNWAVALYHDRFGEFSAALRSELEEDSDFIAAMDKLRAMPEYEKGTLSPVALMNLLPEEKRNLVRTRLLDYVQGNQNQLDMYLVPSSKIMQKMEEELRLR